MPQALDRLALDWATLPWLPLTVFLAALVAWLAWAGDWMAL